MRRFAWHGHALHRLVLACLRPQALAFLPALALAGYWYGLAGLAALLAVLTPLVLFTGGLPGRAPARVGVDALTGLASREGFIQHLDTLLTEAEDQGASVIVLAVGLDGAEALRSRFGTTGLETALLRIADRIDGSVRSTDASARLDGDRFALALSQPRNATVDVAVAASSRVQAAIAEPISLANTQVHITASVGYCLSPQAPEATGRSMVEAAELALAAARHSGTSHVRAYVPAMSAGASLQVGLSVELAEAFERGDIRPWFQPQISTETGSVTGMEALARWHHPDRGMLSPADFLPVIEAAGALDTLGESMVTQSLEALRAWDDAGHIVPRIGVNLSAVELRNPHLLNRVTWDLDRFDLTANRLAIEVLETVVAADADDMVTKNLVALAKLGCTVDLDDFGTAQASIASIRAFAASRIKIDRSFVQACDTDPSQRQMVSAILSLAAELGLDTVAEGVETAGERAVLTELGCTHLQGFGIARPMPFETATDWLTDQQADTPGAGSRAVQTSA